MYVWVVQLNSFLQVSSPKPRVCIYFLSHTFHMFRPSKIPWFDHPNNTWWRVKIMKFLSMLFPPSYLHCRSSVHHQQQHAEKVESERVFRRNVSQKTQLFGVGKTYVFILSLTRQYKSPIYCHAVSWIMSSFISPNIFPGIVVLYTGRKRPSCLNWICLSIPWAERGLPLQLQRQSPSFRASVPPWNDGWRKSSERPADSPRCW